MNYYVQIAEPLPRLLPNEIDMKIQMEKIWKPALHDDRS